MKLLDFFNTYDRYNYVRGFENPRSGLVTKFLSENPDDLCYRIRLI